MKGSKLKVVTVSSLKKELRRVTSLFVRLSEADNDGVCQCVTCNIRKPWNKMFAGHFIPKETGNALYFELRNIHVQCLRCNKTLGGYGAKYYLYMKDRYGERVILDFFERLGTKVVYSCKELQQMIDSRMKLLRPLLDKHNVQG